MECVGSFLRADISRDVCDPAFRVERIERRAPPIWLKYRALSGFLMTLLYVALSVVPIIQVESRLMFAVKIGGLIVITNIIGLAIFVVVGRKRLSAEGS